MDVKVESKGFTCRNRSGLFNRLTNNPLKRSPEAVSDRLDELIKDMKRFTKGPQGRERAPDIVCIAHGHILSALALRWAEQPLLHGMRFLIQTAGVGILW